MSIAAAQVAWTVEDFLAWERQQTEPHEFVGGRIYAMTGPRVGHGRQVNRIAGLLRANLPAGCEVFTEAYLLVAAGDATRPDVIVTCGGPDDDATEFRDAELLIEVVSPSNRPGELREKRDAYLTLASLVAYLVVDGDSYEAWTRVPGGPWQCEQVEVGQFAVELHGRAITL